MRILSMHLKTDILIRGLGVGGVRFGVTVPRTLDYPTINLIPR